MARRRARGSKLGRTRLQERRLEEALRMLEAGEVSVGYAAYHAGLPLAQFIDDAVKRGVKPFSVEGDV